MRRSIWIGINPLARLSCDTKYFNRSRGFCHHRDHHTFPALDAKRERYGKRDHAHPDQRPQTIQSPIRVVLRNGMYARGILKGGHHFNISEIKNEYQDSLLVQRTEAS